jgi:hypothetical protein
MNKTPSNPTTSNLNSSSSVNKHKTVACYQPDKCFQFRKPTNSSNKRTKTFNTLPTNFSLSTESSVRESRNSYPIYIRSLSTQIYPPSANIPTPKLFFQDSVSAYYGISEDPYCKNN